MTTPDDCGASRAAPSPLPAGQMFAPGSELLLADKYEASAVAGYALDSTGGGEQLVVHCSFEGRRNRSTERAAVTVALSPLDALLLLDQLLKAYGTIERRAAAIGSSL